MAGAGGQDVFIARKFVSETELDEQRKKRQEEWEKVRKPEDPEECPEEAYDPRSLFERLQEQKDKKQQEYEEQFKFKNMVKGLDEEESHFLDEVSRQQQLVERQRREEDLKELKEYRSALTKLTANTDNRKEPEKKPTVKPAESKSAFSQARLLAGAVKRRSSDSSDSSKKQRLDGEELSTQPDSVHCGGGAREVGGRAVVHRPSASVCVGILPGLGAYSGSSDSESSSDSEV
ncbi:PSME3-interacting protein [Amia ocellicauda]|uniref:PSME3-interacting protein n=1 Tax=Amia ocellicauda TaxID=2972642 RepID=UPI0034647D9A